MLSSPPKLDARAVKDALRARHPGGGYGGMPGAWTCIEEWNGIDLLAWSAWGSEGHYARIGYEVKVSRSDLRRELLRPGKRARQVAWCNEFYFAVPAGLLKPEELAFEEPEWEPGDFVRPPCPSSSRWRNEGGCYRGNRQAVMVGPLTRWTIRRPLIEVPCPDCDGNGYTSKSRVELEAPMLWIPADVGLVVVTGSGARVVRKSPRRKDVPVLGARELGQLVRWISMRPDPRHARVGPPD